jgi:hypothetical protein
MTARRRAGDTRAALGRGFMTPATPPAPVTADEPASSTEPIQAAPEPKPVMSKYTALLDADTAAEFDGLALMARRKLGRRVDKSEIVRALIRLAADDASLRDQVISEVEKAGR